MEYKPKKKRAFKLGPTLYTQTKLQKVMVGFQQYYPNGSMTIDDFSENMYQLVNTGDVTQVEEGY